MRGSRLPLLSRLPQSRALNLPVRGRSISFIARAVVVCLFKEQRTDETSHGGPRFYYPSFLRFSRAAIHRRSLNTVKAFLNDRASMSSHPATISIITQATIQAGNPGEQADIQLDTACTQISHLCSPARCRRRCETFSGGIAFRFNISGISSTLEISSFRPSLM